MTLTIEDQYLQTFVHTLEFDAYHHTRKTIQNYLNSDYCVTDGHYNARIPGKLAPYEKVVIELRSQGLTYPQIHKILCEKGYTGSVVMVSTSGKVVSPPHHNNKHFSYTIIPFSFALCSIPDI